MWLLVVYFGIMPFIVIIMRTLPPTRDLSDRFMVSESEEDGVTTQVIIFTLCLLWPVSILIGAIIGIYIGAWNLANHLHYRLFRGGL